MKLLDSTFIVDLLRGRTETRSFLEKEKSVCTTIINSYEILSGAFYQERPAPEIMRISRLLSDIPVLQLTEGAVIIAARINAFLLKKGEKMEDADCLVAGIALNQRITTIVTKNKKHYEKIEGLTVETY